MGDINSNDRQPASAFADYYILGADYSLSQLQAQLTSQLKQEEAELQAEEEFRKFIGGTTSELLTEQQQTLGRAGGIMQTALIPAYESTYRSVGGMVVQRAAEVEAQLADDPARQLAMTNLRRAAAGKFAPREARSTAEASWIRGEAGIDLDVSGLKTAGQAIAAPAYYKQQLADLLRPFQTQAVEAGIAQNIAETQAAPVLAQAQTLGQLTEIEAGGIGALANIYGGTAQRQPTGTMEAITSLFGNYNYLV